MNLFMWNAVPFFVTFFALGVALEFAILKWQKRPANYDLQEVKVSAQIYLAQVFTNGLFRTTNGLILYYIYQYRFLDWNGQFWLIFPVGLFISEFCFYWSHRFGHRVRWGWVNHLVHHTPDQYNFSAGWRLSLTAPLSLGWVFFLPMALLGFDYRMMAFYILLNQIYGVALHTVHDPKFGWLEKIFVTPSHHRVHHDTAPESLDKNYGNIFIIFDRMFGTFKEEDKSKAHVYGVLDKIDSRSFFDSAFGSWIQLFQDLRKYPGLKTKIKLICMPPGWQPEPVPVPVRTNPEDLKKTS